MGTFVLKRKIYTVYDDTDQLKRMKDSDILAEKQKNTNYAPVVAKAATGAALGAAGLGAAGGVYKLFKGKGPGFRGGLALGATAGAALAGGLAMKNKNREQSDNDMYNRRLRYAQKQARRRESADWKANMTTRDGYSY